MAATEMLLTPSIQGAVGKLHDPNNTQKRKAMEGHQKMKQKIYKAKGGGQWEICKHMKACSPTPLIALRQEIVGPRGQVAGTITTDEEGQGGRHVAIS